MGGNIALAVCALIACAGGILDVKDRRIPNWLCILLGLCAFGYLIISSDFNLRVGASAGLHALIALVIGMLLFRIGMLGGGDAKFYTGAALGLPLTKALAMLGWTSIAGLIMLLVMVVMRKLGMPVGPRDKKGRALVPYGVAIAVGFVTTLLLE